MDRKYSKKDTKLLRDMLNNSKSESQEQPLKEKKGWFSFLPSRKKPEPEVQKPQESDNIQQFPQLFERGESGEEDEDTLKYDPMLGIYAAKTLVARIREGYTDLISERDALIEEAKKPRGYSGKKVLAFGLACTILTFLTYNYVSKNPIFFGGISQEWREDIYPKIGGYISKIKLKIKRKGQLRFIDEIVEYEQPEIKPQITEKATKQQDPGFRIYVVQPGDTVGKVKKRLGVSVAQLREWNPILNQERCIKGKCHPAGYLLMGEKLNYHTNIRKGAK